ncbi:MAG: alpha/beta hydrolase [Actinomycetota bacterium]|nr:alpha/beta hydrolase [Actinomycetota bacterium]
MVHDAGDQPTDGDARRATATPTAGVEEPVSIRTADDLTLDGRFRLPEGAPAIVVIAHPHPTYGGSMEVPLVVSLARAVADAGYGSLRFDFRGVGRSGGTHEGGRGEPVDVAAAVHAAHDLAGGAPVVLAGWSFGADMTLTCTDDVVAGWCTVAAPLRFAEGDALAAGADERPKLLVVPRHDQFRDPDAAAEATASWPATDLVVVEGADHSLMGFSADVAAHLVGFVERVVSPAA